MHRLSFTPSLPSGNWICGLCRKKIDENYGEYSCTKGCAYAVHSKCATRRDVWDEKELEDQPEMVYENLKSFEVIGDGTIRHFSHEHHYMRLNIDIQRGVYDERRRCQACMLLPYDGNVYSCMECDFALHEACANLPRLKQNRIHAHWFTLKPGDTGSFFQCFSCRRMSCGFSYVCRERCADMFTLDVRCASMPEKVDYQSHPHPLFWINERRYFKTCSICTGDESCTSLSCVECDFSLCFRCATLPRTVKHEDDEHMLTLSYESSASNHPYWCQVCEKNTDLKKGYNACKECGVTIHIECILGRDFYMKPGEIITKFTKAKIEIIPNNRSSRPICSGCQRRCQYNIAYKISNGNIYCSLAHMPPFSRIH